MTVESFDPFAQSVSTTGLTPDDLDAIEAEEPEHIDIIDPSPAQTGEWKYEVGISEIPKGNGYFAWDLETVPDETRYPKPEEVKHEPRVTPENTLGILKTEATVKEFLAEGCCEEDAQDLLQAEQDGKCRKGVLSVLKSFAEGGDEDMQKWHKLGTDTYCCRIVALGVCFYSDPVPKVMTAKNLSEEREILRQFWSIHDTGKTRVGYNTASFDDRVVIARSLILGVFPGQKMSVGRFSKQSVDIALKLFTGIQDMRKLKPLLRDVGIDPPAGDIDGSMVLNMVENGQWDQLEMYVGSDAWSEMELFKRVQQVLEV